MADATVDKVEECWVERNAAKLVLCLQWHEWPDLIRDYADALIEDGFQPDVALAKALNWGGVYFRRERISYGRGL